LGIHQFEPYCPGLFCLVCLCCIPLIEQLFEEPKQDDAQPICANLVADEDNYFVIPIGASLAFIECMRQPLFPRHSTKYRFGLWIMLGGAVLRHGEE
jgi:hypothetical protein